MGIYATRIEQMFQDLPEIENILQIYDNVTYHIQFFMVPRNIQFDYMHERGVINSDYYQQINLPNHTPEEIEAIKRANSEALYNLDRKLIQRAVIIAESGVTNTINVESLTMITHPPASSEQFGATTVEMELKLAELNAASLTNKVALASYLCGYESYCYQQYFINIWFTGYDPITGKPIKKIPLNNNGLRQCLYQVTMGDVKTNSESNKTIYTIKLYPSFYSSLSKDVNIVSNLGELELQSEKTFTGFVQLLEEKVNEKLKAQYGDRIINEIYAGYTPLSINVAESLANKIGVVRQKALMGEVSSVYEYQDDRIIISSDAYNSMTPEERIQAMEAPSSQGFFEKTYRGMVDGFKKITGGYQVKLTPEKEDTIISILQKMMSHYALVMDGEVLTIHYDNMYVGNFKGVNYFKHIITIGKAKVPGLKDIQENVIGQDYENLYEAKPSIFQEKYLQEIRGYNLLQKKYFWMHNGKNTNVLSVKTEDENMWYLNLGLTDLYAVSENLPTTEYNPNKDEEIHVYKSRLAPPATEGEVLKEAKHYYIDDIYNYFVNSNQYKSMVVSSWHKIAESNSSLNELPVSSAVVHNDKDAETLNSDAKTVLENEIRYRLGMENLFQVTNQKIKLELDIIGDPYWMFFGDTTNSSAQHNLVLPHLLLFQKSFMVADAFDNYEEDKIMEYNSLYMVTKIVSTFEGGTFKQRITGHVATPFIQSSRFEDAKTYMSSLTTSQRRAVITYEQANGEVTHQ